MGYILLQEKDRHGNCKFRFDLYWENKRYRKTVRCRKSAVHAIYRDWEEKIVQNAMAIKSHKLFDKFSEYLVFCKGMKSKTQYKAESRSFELFKKCFDNMYISEFKRKHGEEYILWRRTNAQYQNTMKSGQVSNATINRDLSALSSFFTWATRMEYALVNPVSGMKLDENNSIEVKLTNEQIQTIIDKSYKIDKMFYSIVALLILTGCRKNEILNLKWNNVYFDSNIFILQNTKNKKPHAVYITGLMNDILLDLYSNRIDDYVTTQKYTKHVMRKHWDKLLEKIDFADIGNGRRFTPHLLRHVYAQTLLDAGVSLDDISSLLNHADVTVTQKRYAMFSRPDLREKAGRIDKIINIKR